MRFWFIYLTCIIMVPATSWAKNTWTLQDLYQQALNQSETIQISAEQIRETRARFLQILGGTLPQIGHADSVFIQDKAATGSSDVGSTFTSRYRPESRIYFHQTVFQGFAEYHTAKIRRSSLNKAGHELKFQELKLFADISTVYITWLRLGRDINEYQKILNVGRNRFRELSSDVKIGKSRPSESLAEETELKMLEVRLEQLRADKKIAEDALMWMTNLNPLPKLAAPRFDFKKLPANPTVAKRPDLLAQKETTKITEGELKVARSNMLPHINADANYYHYRSGFQKDIDWDATFSMDFPLVNVQNWGEVKVNKSRLRQASLQERQVFENASQSLEKARIRLESARKQVKLVGSASTVAQQRFQATQEDLKVGRTSTLDILEAQRYYLETLTQKNETQSNLELSYINYWLETGQIP